MLSDRRADAGAQIAGNTNLHRNLPGGKLLHQFGILRGSKPVTDPFRREIQCSPHRPRPGCFTSMRRKPKAIGRGVGKHVAKQFRSGLALVAADAKSDHARVLKPRRQLGHLLCLLRAKLAHRIKDPEQRNAEVALTTFPAALQANKDRIKVLLAPQAHSHRDVHFGVQHILRLKFLHQPIGDEFVILGSLQFLSHSLERHQKLGEVLVAIKLLHLYRLCFFRVTRFQLDQSRRIDRTLEMQMQLSLGEGEDKVAGLGAHTSDCRFQTADLRTLKRSTPYFRTAIRITVLPSDLAGLHVLRAKTKPDDPSWNAPQNWPAPQELQRPRNRERLGAAQNSADHIVLDQDLEPLRCASRKIPPLLDRLKIAFSDVVLSKFWAEYVCCRDPILNRQIDSYPADRRHGMSGIPDT